jgi:hypothetical protein
VTTSIPPVEGNGHADGLSLQGKNFSYDVKLSLEKGRRRIKALTFAPFFRLVNFHLKKAAET